MKIVLEKENGIIRALEGSGEVRSAALALRSRINAGEVKYYALDFDESLGLRLEAYIAALNKYPKLLEESNMITEIS